ncbi:MAG: TniQ family protein [Sphingopyxis sp.]|nr:TniQ family protein [Sphingopyxis sp.]
MRLRLRVRQKEGEGALELALRLAARNGFSDLGSFLKVHRLNLDTKYFEAAIEKIAELSGIPGEALREWTVSPTPAYLMRGEKLGNRHFVPLYRRYCPLCLAEDFRQSSAGEPIASIPYVRGWWRTSLIYACPAHHCAMVDTCSDCGSRTSVEAVPLERCVCGFQFKNATLSPLRPEDLIANEYVWGRLSKQEKLASPVLDALPLWQVADVLRRIGTAALVGRTEIENIPLGAVGAKSVFSLPSADLGKILSAGFEYAREGRPSLLKLIEKMTDGPQFYQLEPKQMFGKEFGSWASSSKNPIRAVIQEIWGAGPVHLMAKPKVLHELEQARLEARLGYKFGGPVTHTDAFVAGRDAQILLSKLDADEWVGGERYIFHQFASAEVITPAWHCHGKSNEAFYLEDLQGLVDGINAVTRPIEPKNRIARLAWVIRKYDDNSAPVIIGRILRGELPVFRHGTGPFLTSFWAPGWAEPRGKEIRFLSRGDVASLLSVDLKVVEDLLTGGVLSISPDTPNLIDIEHVTPLSRNYLTARRLQSICSTAMAPAAIDEWLKNLGVSSLLRPGCVGIFPRRMAIRTFYKYWTADLETSLSFPRISGSTASMRR